jgi:hypothetical protein
MQVRLNMQIIKMPRAELEVGAVVARHHAQLLPVTLHARILSTMELLRGSAVGQAVMHQKT